MARAAPALHLLIACGPAAPGAGALVERATRALETGRAVRTILTGAGLLWIGDPRLARLAGTPGGVCVCSRSARDRGLGPSDTGTLAWSSLVAWARDLPSDAALWAALP